MGIGILPIPLGHRPLDRALHALGSECHDPGQFVCRPIRVKFISRLQGTGRADSIQYAPLPARAIGPAPDLWGMFAFLFTCRL